jgi:hypothetical protein
MTTSPRSSTVDALAWRVAEDGVERHLDDVVAFGHQALSQGACSVLVAVMLDPDEPPIARQRAFGAVAAALAAPKPLSLSGWQRPSALKRSA